MRLQPRLHQAELMRQYQPQDNPQQEVPAFKPLG